MEVFFLDVGQGTGQVVLLGGRRAIVIDCGVKNDRMVLHFLRRMGIDFIQCLIVSHSHNDHIGGAVAILDEYQDRIGKIFFVQDNLFLESSFWLRITALLKDGTLNRGQLVRLEATDNPQLVWWDDSVSARIRTFSPSAAENLLAQAAARQNPTSAVLFLDVDRHRVIFAADSEVAQWQEIYQKSGQRQTCDILAVPHHAGATASTSEELRWLFDEGLEPKVAIVSVGTSNTHRHPRPEVIQAMSARGINILCTQITRKCCDNLESLRPGVLQPITVPGRSSPTKDLTSGKNSRNVACAGSVRATISTDSLAIDRLAEHQQSVNCLKAAAGGHPLCRP